MSYVGAITTATAATSKYSIVQHYNVMYSSTPVQQYSTSIAVVQQYSTLHSSTVVHGVCVGAGCHLQQVFNVFNREGWGLAALFLAHALCAHYDWKPRKL